MRAAGPAGGLKYIVVKICLYKPHDRPDPIEFVSTECIRDRFIDIMSCDIRNYFQRRDRDVELKRKAGQLELTPLSQVMRDFNLFYNKWVEHNIHKR